MTTARYARIVALADVNNTPNSSACEFEFLDSTDTPFSTAGWTVAPSSENDTPGNDYRALHAIDGATTGDFWHTLFDGAEPGHPHWLDIDFGSAIDVRKVVFYPRPSGSNGSLTRYQIYLRAAGSTDWEPYLHEPSVVSDFTYVGATSPTFGAIPTPNTAGVQFVAARRKRNGAGDSTCTRPPGVDDGDYCVLWIWGLGSNDTPTLVDDAVGFTLLERRDNGADQFIAAYGGFVGSGDASWGATTSGYTSFAACFYRNVDTSTPVAATADASGSSDSPVAPTVTASAADSVLVVSTMGTTSGFTGNSGCTLPSGMVLRIADLDTTIEVADELVGSGATGTRTVVMGAASQDWLAISLILNPVTGGGGSTPMGRGDETDSALALSTKKTRAASVTTETDAALALARLKRRAVGVAAETETAFALAPRKYRAVGRSDETDSALALSKKKTTATSLATETDNALALAQRKLRGVALATETETASALAQRKIGAIGRADEVDTAFALQEGGSQQLPMGRADETDTALALARLKRGTVGLATESDAAIGLSGKKTRGVGLGAETDTALALARLKKRATGLAVGVEASLQLSGRKLRSADLSVEVDTAPSLAQLKLRGIGIGAETNVALALARLKKRAYGRGDGVDVALSLFDPTITRPIGRGDEVDSAFALVGRKIRAVGIASETSAALPLVGLKRATISRADETDAALALALIRSQNYGICTDASSAFQLASLKRRGIGMATETDVAFAIGAPPATSYARVQVTIKSSNLASAAIAPASGHATAIITKV